MVLLRPGDKHAVRFASDKSDGPTAGTHDFPALEFLALNNLVVIGGSAGGGRSRRSRRASAGRARDPCRLCRLEFLAPADRDVHERVEIHADCYIAYIARLGRRGLSPATACGAHWPHEIG